MNELTDPSAWARRASDEHEARMSQLRDKYGVEKITTDEEATSYLDETSRKEKEAIEIIERNRKARDAHRRFLIDDKGMPNMPLNPPGHPREDYRVFEHHLPADPRPGATPFPGFPRAVRQMNQTEATLRQFPALAENDPLPPAFMKPGRMHEYIVEQAEKYAETPEFQQKWGDQLPVAPARDTEYTIPFEFHDKVPGFEGASKTGEVGAYFDNPGGQWAKVVHPYDDPKRALIHERHHFDTRNSPVRHDPRGWKKPPTGFSGMAPPKWLQNPHEVAADAREAKFQYANDEEISGRIKEPDASGTIQLGTLRGSGNPGWNEDHPSVKNNEPLPDEIVDEIFQNWMKNDSSGWGKLYEEDPENFPVELFKEAIKVGQNDKPSGMFTGDNRQYA